MLQQEQEHQGIQEMRFPGAETRVTNHEATQQDQHTITGPDIQLTHLENIRQQPQGDTVPVDQQGTWVTKPRTIFMINPKKEVTIFKETPKWVLNNYLQLKESSYSMLADPGHSNRIMPLCNWASFMERKSMHEPLVLAAAIDPTTLDCLASRMNAERDKIFAR